MSDDHVEARLESDHFPCDDVQIIKLTGRETISRLFQLEVDVAVPGTEGLPADEIVGCEVAVVLARGGLEVRRIHGMVTAIEDMLDSEPELRTYRLRIGPVASRLTLVEVQDVFLNMSVPEIITHKLALVGLGAGDVELRLLGTYPKREFVVQYRESDLAFVSRLAEHAGISFFFEHADGRDTMVFTDHPGGFRPIERPGGDDERPGSVPFRRRGERRDVFRLAWQNTMMPKTWAVQDYDYRTPHVELTGQHACDVGTAGGVVEFGTHHETAESGRRLAQVRAEERQALCRCYSGASDLAELCAGGVVTLDGHPRIDGEKALLVVEVTHSLVQPATGHAAAGAVFEYSNTFSAVDASTAYRPPRVTPKPRIFGVLAGHIEPGPDGTIGDVAARDDLGRYIVKFSFDPTPLGQRSRSSLPVRMIHPHGGPGYGIQMPLETGVEVLVAFLDGDPDRPVIVGAAYSQISPPPVRAEEHLFHRIRTKAGIEIEMKDL